MMLKVDLKEGNEYLFLTQKYSNHQCQRQYGELNRLYESYLTTNFLRRGYPYSFTQDLNGDFMIRTLQGSENGNIEADYSWVHFSLSAPVELLKIKKFMSMENSTIMN